MEIKVCGITNAHDINALKSMKINRLGFIFYDKSPRNISDLPLEKYLKDFPSRIKKVGVFVNSEASFIKKQIDRLSLDAIQLHGNESPEFCSSFKKGIEVIKAFSIKDENSLIDCNTYLDSCDYFLFDTYTPNYGGSGLNFDWSLLHNYKLSKPFFLSGGIDLSSLDGIKRINNPFLCGIDVNSKFEIKPGIKDINKINELIKQLIIEY